VPTEYSTNPSPITDDIPLDEVLDSLIQIHNKLEDGEYRFSDREFVDELSSINSEFGYETLLLYPDDVPEELKGTGWGSKEVYKQTLENLPHLEFLGFLCLMFEHIRQDDPNSATELFANYHDCIDEKEVYEGYLNFCESYVIRYNEHNIEWGDVQEARKIAMDSVAECPAHHLIFLNCAEAIIRYVEKNSELNEPTKNNELQDSLDNAIGYIRQANRLEQNYSRGHVILANAIGLRGDYQEAISEINEAHAIEQDPKKPSYVDIRRLDQLRREFELKREANNLRTEIKSIDDTISRTQDEVDDLGDELDNSLERFRSNSLQFIGFFAAVITLAVTSANVVVSSSRPLLQDAGLIIILTGGLLLGFGSLGLILPKNNEEYTQNRRRVFSVVFIGAILMGAGLTAAIVL
jgi:tetratricopeptide (TPR) repeat protein